MASQPAVGGQTVDAFAETFEAVVDNVARVLEGKEDPTRLALVCLAAEGHLLLEDVPGVGKTSLAKALARSFDLDWRRIQFTPDLLPSDVTGASVYDRDSGAFTFRPGGVFANVVLGGRDQPGLPEDPVRAAGSDAGTPGHGRQRDASPACTVPGDRHPESGGARGHLSAAGEPAGPVPAARAHGIPRSALLRWRCWTAPTAGSIPRTFPPSRDRMPSPAMVALASSVHVAHALKGYIVDLATATRNHPALSLGMSPRAALALQRAARA